MKRALTEIKPNLRTPPDALSGNEKAKMATNGLRTVTRDIQSPTNLSYQMRNLASQDVQEVAEMLEKSYGIYLEYNRALTGSEPDWMYMLRINVPGGGPMTRRQWQIIDDVATRYTETDNYTGRKLPSLRLTTRENIQLHWVRKKNLVDSVREIAESGFFTLNGCGDNVRNTLGCPLGHFSKVFDSNLWAQKVGRYFQLPRAAFLEIFEIDPKYLRVEGEKVSGGGDDDSPGQFDYGDNLLNRKFKIGVSGIIYDEEKKSYRPENCVELRTNDIGVAPILESGKVSRVQVYIGGGQGEKAGYPTFSASGQPFGVFDVSNLIKGLDAIVRVHKEWGDRQNRNWARLKYDIYKMGIDWYRNQVKETGVEFEPPIENFDYGPREMHHGWTRHESRDGFWHYGAFIENGRLTDASPNGNLKTMVRYLMDNYDDLTLLTTPNQDLIFSGIGEEFKEKFAEDLAKHGYGKRDGIEFSRLRKLSGACVGRDTCRLTYTESEKFEPFLIDELEKKWGTMSESVGVTGCERQCFRPGTKTIGWVGSALNMYTLKIGGSEDARVQGGLLIDPSTQQVYLKIVPRKEVVNVTDALFEFYVTNRQSQGREAEPGGMGYFLRRVGARGIIEALKKNPKTSALMVRSIRNPLAFDPGLANPSLR